MAKLTTEEIIEALKEMTLLEAKDLVDAICETFGVSADAPAAEASVAADRALLLPRVAPLLRRRPSSTSFSRASATTRSPSSRSSARSPAWA